MKNIRSFLTLVLISALLTSFAILFPARSTARSQTLAAALDGFTPQGASAQRRWEEQFRAVPAAKSAREHLRLLTAEPHVAGTIEDYTTAIYVRDQMRSYGLKAELKEYEVLLPYPKQPSVVELVGQRRERLTVKEAVVPDDPTSSNPKIIPLFNGYSPSGDVTAP
ncbi:MAG: hypothetical protein ACREBG_10480, partial [Pyrinomonadaceae bacterium]